VEDRNFKWLVTAQFKTEVQTKFVADGVSPDDVAAKITASAAEDNLEDFKITDIQLFEHVQEEVKDNRVLN